MIKKRRLVLLFIAISFTSWAQPSGHSWDSIMKLTVIDHQRMMTLLNITSLRPGVDGYESQCSQCC